MPKQIPKQCRWCSYTAGNGGALSSHAKTKHPAEWDAFKAEQASARPSERPTLSVTEAPEPESFPGFRMGVYFRVEVAEEDTSRWQPTADLVLDLLRQAVAMADLPANVEILQSGRGSMLPTRTLEGT